MATLLLLAALLGATASAATDRTAQIVVAPDSPVQLKSARILGGDSGADPLVLLYAATNATSEPIDTFTVRVFIFSGDGQLKARQVAPARRELGVGETKYSAMVLDVGTVEPNDILIAGVDQVQKVGSNVWWRADLQPLAETTASRQVQPSSRKR